LLKKSRCFYKAFALFVFSKKKSDMGEIHISSIRFKYTGDAERDEWIKAFNHVCALLKRCNEPALSDNERERRLLEWERAKCCLELGIY
jgi:hypothetical protein